jgi:hypothetical protein
MTDQNSEPTMGHGWMQSSYVAQAIVEGMRRGSLPSASDAMALDRIPLIDALRLAVFANDRPWLLSLMCSADEWLAGLGVSLLRHHTTDASVIEAMKDRWASAPAYLRTRLLWRLLDRDGLDVGWHEQLQAHALAQWPVFAGFNRAFYGTGTKGFSRILARVADPAYPSAKKWAYLASLPSILDDPASAIAVIEMMEARYPFLQSRFSEQLGQVVLVEREHESMPDTNPLGFVARCVVAKLRRNDVPDEADADLMNRVPFIDVLRQTIVAGDQAWIWKGATGTGERAGLYLSLLRRLDHGPDIQAGLKELWKTSDAFAKSHILWRILDDPALPLEWHQEIFAFVMSEWPVFQDVCRKFLGEPDLFLAQALERYADPHIPESKKWSHMCRIQAAPLQRAAQLALLRLGAVNANAFTQRVAKDLLTRFHPAEATG